MARIRQIEVRRYRGGRIAIMDDGGAGWVLKVYLPGDAGSRTIRNHTPNGIGTLLKEAVASIDRALGASVPPDYP